MDERQLEIASFRYRIIADAVEADDQSLTDLLQQAASRSYLDLRGREVDFHVRSLWRWLKAWREGGLLALCPAPRKDRKTLRAFPPGILDRAAMLRREKPKRPTQTIIDILVRKKLVTPDAIVRSTLDRHLADQGLSRRALHTLGEKVFRQILTEAPFELVVTDFHHGPYVRLGSDSTARRALLCAFIDHFSRFVPEGRYYLHEDFAALRFGFRRLLLGHGLMEKLYLDNGAPFQATRFHLACDQLGIRLIHSKPYAAEGRGMIERFNRTLKEQFEEEVRDRDELLTLDELNAYFEAWLAERYHRDRHSETGEPPLDRFLRTYAQRSAPDLDLVDEWLRLRERRTVHKKWSIVEVNALRYAVEPSLRGRRVEVLYDPFDPSYVLIVFDGRLVQRALPHQPGALPPEVPAPPTGGPPTDYLALLRRDYEKRTQAELASLRLRPTAASPEMDLPDLVALLERCRAGQLTPAEKSEAGAFWRRFRPIDAQSARAALERTERRLGSSLHLRVYLDALKDHLVRSRTKGGKKP